MESFDSTGSWKLCLLTEANYSQFRVSQSLLNLLTFLPTSLGSYVTWKSSKGFKASICCCLWKINSQISYLSIYVIRTNILYILFWRMVIIMITIIQLLKYNWLWENEHEYLQCQTSRTFRLGQPTKQCLGERGSQSSWQPVICFWSLRDAKHPGLGKRRGLVIQMFEAMSPHPPCVRAPGWEAVTPMIISCCKA